MTGSTQTTPLQDDFSVYVPNVVEILEKADGEVDPDSRRIGGYCSTEDLDRQGEIVVQKGLDFDEFVRYGYFNDNHKQDTAAVLGYPDLAEPRGGKWWTEGRLIAGYPPADRIWELARALAKSKAPRKLGFSIEGRVLERDGHNRILRAKVRHVALTASPVNVACSWSVMSKAFAPADDVVKAAERAGSGGGRVERSTSVGASLAPNSFAEAVAKIRHRWPQISEAVARRAAAFAFTRE